MIPELDEFLKQPPDPSKPYVYRGTNVHINKFGILNPDALEQVIRTISGLRAEMLLSSPRACQFDFAHLREIHRYLFQDIYEWAGAIRVVDFSVDSFVPANEIVSEAEQVFAQLELERQLQDLSGDAFADRLTYFLWRLYRVHPFRDGNGRSLRIFFTQLARERGYDFDFDSVPKGERHLSAKTAHEGDMGPLTALVRRAVTPRRIV
jgi:cell filamentation protein, protein adenylyltransferase